MQFHANHRLGLLQRQALCLAVERGSSIRAAAREFSVSPATAHRWWHRWLGAEEAQRSSLRALHDRSSRPHRSPRQLSPAEEEPILEARRQTNLGPGRLAGIVKRSRSTIWKVLHRHGLSRRLKNPRRDYRRYEWTRPGALLHVDMARLARFEQPGHRVKGRSEQARNRGAGYIWLHCVVDDHSRYAYVEQAHDETGATAAAVLERAIAHFVSLGLDPPEAVMSDNALAYRRSAAFQKVLTDHEARHILTPIYTPRWNGKVERFIQTLKTEWAYAHSWPSSKERTRALPSFLRYYNRRRPHSSVGDRPPISRVHNVFGQDI
jgi:transposase InsO family protein